MRWWKARTAVLVAALVAVWPAAAADKPNPPAPPEAPRDTAPAPPSHPGLGTGPVQPSGPADTLRAAASRADPVGFEGHGPTAVVPPGAPLRASVVVSASGPAGQVVVRWSVDGEPVGDTRVVLRAGVQRVTSPPLPTEKPGRYVVDASVQGATAPPVATSYTVLGRTGPERLDRELVAVLAPKEGADRRAADQAGLVLVSSRALESTGEVLATFRVPEGADPDQALRRLRSLPDVVSADYQTLAEGSAGGLRSLQYAPTLIQLPAALRWSSGRGVRVAVVDAAVDSDHPELRGKLDPQVDFTASPARPEVHGTAVAGIIASHLELLGVAPDARLLPLRACAAVRPGGLDARCRSEDLVRAVDHALKAGARVVNLSVGGPQDANLSWVVARAVERGVLVVAAAGGPQGASYPAALPGVVAVGASDRLDRRDPTSPTGSFLSLVAPGVDVLAAAPAGRYVFVSGTSFAAAHVSGAAALAVALSPSLASLAVRAALERSAVDLGKPGFDPEYGWGRLSACRALTLVRPSARCAP